MFTIPAPQTQRQRGLTLLVDRGFLSCGISDGNSVMVARWPMAIAMQTIRGQSSVELELDSAIGQATIFTDADQMLLCMTEHMLFC